MLSVIIPAHNEADCIEETLRELGGVLEAEGIDYEIIVVDDWSTDGTADLVAALKDTMPGVECRANPRNRGFGSAVQAGIAFAKGDYVALFMADCSDSPIDLVTFHRTIQEGGYDAVFGSRFSGGGFVKDYPFPKLVLNRLANWIIKAIFRLEYDDLTNAFKLYRRETLKGLEPYLAPHFNITVELPLKTIVRGYTYTWLPNSWQNRRAGVSKFDIREMGSRYVFVLAYCLIEKYFSRGDYVKRAKSHGQESSRSRDTPV